MHTYTPTTLSMHTCVCVYATGKINFPFLIQSSKQRQTSLSLSLFVCVSVRVYMCVYMIAAQKDKQDAANQQLGLRHTNTHTCRETAQEESE